MRGGILIAALLTAAAGATTAPPLTLEQQVKKAELIVRGTLGAAVSVKEGEVTYLAYPLTVAETITGDAARLPQNDGKPALFFLQGLADVPNLKTGQEVFALLYTAKLDSPLVGFNQGLYPVTDGKVLAGDAKTPITDPAKLRDAIRAALGSK
ncbi:hypothetical protein [Deinococcus arenicola]|uniref:Uncharacterized protein n=1 Tax=Deinococcus arenicola TaxID=2994950 RepID=A0ABU4DLS6_9DEIO|nr:hypothetical protein [Deinococcus sp. ZS9-10]MDV6373388.1 hypothetical protein [Deinococcus sp. ZS9-10]